MSAPGWPLALRLAKLPVRVPVKLTITLDRATHALLTAYTEAYRSLYGADDELGDLIPFMLKQFVESDRGFARMRSAHSQPRTNIPKEGD